ncbi:uncharacterized protein LOC131841579 [Achroia grisella]|uniref:uncharacterized protein LOC131841579 n=1 Tax=Achroia grisella TaxID=688607 RepID=UPI0027D24AB8|nr:uncharacterized protein LOC131841579 [Achroia grisella]
MQQFASGTSVEKDTQSIESAKNSANARGSAENHSVFGKVEDGEESEDSNSFVEEVNKAPSINENERIELLKQNTATKKPDPQYEIEKAAGDLADMMGTNQHYSYPTEYKDFGRRFVPQFPYFEAFQKKNNNQNNGLLPRKASPDVVLAVAKESAQLEAAKPINPTDELIKKEILRTGNYWNAVWVEDVNPKELLRNYRGKHTAVGKDTSDLPLKLKSVKAKIMPGSKLYQLVSVLKQYSPKLLYVINEK